MDRVIFFLLILTFTKTVTASSENIIKENWNGVDVVWLKDNRFPTYNIIIYFADGALSDRSGVNGETEFMFDLLDAGTTRYHQFEISDALEYYGAGYGASVNHEYSEYSISGLEKDVVPTLKMVCHLFHEAAYPAKEIKKYKKRVSTSLSNIVTNPGRLASRIFREVSLKGTPYLFPTGGKIKTIKKINAQRLKEKLDYFKTKVRKRLYITGSDKVVPHIKKILLNDCGFAFKSSTFERKAPFTAKKIDRKLPVFFAPMKSGNQAQIRFGRFLSSNEIDSSELIALSSGLLGGGYTSILMQEVRVKRGLSYGISAYAGRQKEYGRSNISTSTKSGSVVEMLTVIREVINRAGEGKIDPKNLSKAMNFLAGRYMFGLEQKAAFLKNLQHFDHVGMDYQRFFDFPQIIKTFSLSQVSSMIKKIYGGDNQFILVVGNADILANLKKFSPVKVIKYTDFL